MAATPLTAQEADHNTLKDLSFAACNADGSYFTWDNKQALIIKNTSGGDLTVKIDNPNACSLDADETIHDETHTVNNGDETLIDVSAERFKNTGDSNRVNITYPGGVTSLTVALIKLGGQNN